MPANGPSIAGMARSYGRQASTEPVFGHREGPYAGTSLLGDIFGDGCTDRRHS
ncbi:MAG: hypothetical protein GAK45_00170 [Pseudomonas citronellolis]|nr:MAG: hypothetical protein GAK45_00170 [Pseudomonas citronellolis]